jgi:uncharacterized protein (DUF983 family)
MPVARHRAAAPVCGLFIRPRLAQSLRDRRKDPMTTYPGPTAAPAAHPDDRPMRRSILRGLRRRCPHCGQGPLFEGYLKVADRCPVCREEYHHHRADDGPAYLTILVVGHLLAPLLHVIYSAFRPEPLVFATVLSVLAVALSLYLLPRLKGLVVAIQWSRRMHGFGAGDAAT